MAEQSDGAAVGLAGLNIQRTVTMNELAEREQAMRKALSLMITLHAPHSGLCCLYGAGGSIRVTRKSCKCSQQYKEIRDLIGAWDE
jgi:hypothetical protein